MKEGIKKYMYMYNNIIQHNLQKDKIIPEKQI